MGRGKSINSGVHHRRCRSLGGDKGSRKNKSRLDKTDHANWHIIAGNLNAIQTADHFNLMTDKLGIKPQYVKISCKFINGSPVMEKGMYASKNEIKFGRAWESLFGKLSFPDILYFINKKLLDHSYCFVLE